MKLFIFCWEIWTDKFLLWCNVYKFLFHAVCLSIVCVDYCRKKGRRCNWKSKARRKIWKDLKLFSRRKIMKLPTMKMRWELSSVQVFNPSALKIWLLILPYIFLPLYISLKIIYKNLVFDQDNFQLISLRLADEKYGKIISHDRK